MQAWTSSRVNSGWVRRMSSQVWPSTINETTWFTVTQVPLTTGEMSETSKSKTRRSSQIGGSAGASPAAGTSNGGPDQSLASPSNKGSKTTTVGSGSATYEAGSDRAG